MERKKNQNEEGSVVYHDASTNGELPTIALVKKKIYPGLDEPSEYNEVIVKGYDLKDCFDCLRKLKEDEYI